MATGIGSYSKTAASNSNASSEITLSDSMSPDAVDNTQRQIMGDIAEWRDDTGGALATSGTDTYTVSTNGSISSLAAGARLCVRIGTTNTGAATLNPDSLGAKAIRKIVGGSDVALEAGDLRAGDAYDLIYVTSLNSSAGGWLIVGRPRPAMVGIQLITGSATYTPTAGTRTALVILQAAGGGGGGVNTTSGTGRGGGGGAGETRWGVVAISGTVSVTIGAIGSGASAGNNSGGTASDSTFGASITAKGGVGGGGSTGATDGTAGSTPTGSGGVRIAPTMIPENENVTLVRNAGCSVFGLGGLAVASAGHGGASANSGYGGGGGGGYDAATNSRAGGDGAPGMCLIIEFA